MSTQPDQDWHTKVPLTPVTRYCLDCRATREVEARMCPTCGHDHEACTVCCDDRLRPTTDVVARADGKPRMTNAQRDRLWQLCANYNVPFREDDYILAGKQASIGAGWVEGWVGGRDGSGITSRTTLYVGVSPEGESHS
jgi:hypothetical protein